MRKPPAISTTTRNHGNTQLDVTMGIIGNEIEPQFEYVDVVNDAEKLHIRGRRMPSGNELLRIPYHAIDASDNSKRLLVYSDPAFDKAILNLDLDTLGTETFGIIIGDRDPRMDYLLWAFFDTWHTRNGILKGFGLSRFPDFSGCTCTVNGAFDSLATFSIPGAGNAYTYTVGARVVIRQNTGGGALVHTSIYNQGTIVARPTSTTIQVQLDPSYSAAPAIVDSPNGSLSGLTTLNIRQLSKFHPMMKSEDARYPGGGTEYAWSLLGCVQLNASENLTSYRKRGDMFYPINQNGMTNNGLMLYSSITATSVVDRPGCLARYIGFHVRDAEFVLLSQGTGGTGRQGYDPGRRDTLQVSAIPLGQNREYGGHAVGWGARVYISTTLAAGQTIEAYVSGWRETEF